MNSPFVGMDPYIEACGLWEGFHERLIARIDEALASTLPPSYSIDIATRSYIVLMEDNGKEEHLAVPDETVPAGAVIRRAYGADRMEETFVEIYREGEERVLVTCIEVLSPSNKRPGTDDQQVYRRKRQALLLGQAHFVEIDLLRGGRMPMIDPWPRGPYALLVCRSYRAPNCDVWPASFDRRLPVIPVPLAFPDPDLALDLQPLIDDIYSRYRYHERIDYKRDLVPAPSEEEAIALRNLLSKPRKAPRQRSTPRRARS